MLAALLAITLAQTHCAAPSGTDAVLDADKRFLVVGEMHGTTETPAAFAAMVCEAAARGPVSVALELPQSMQTQLDAMLAAESDASAEAALAGSWFLDPSVRDGRTSQAMLALMLSLRGLREEGRDIAVVAFQPVSAAAGRLPQAYYELSMGHLLGRAAVDRPQARVLVLVGNIHAGKTVNPRIGLPAVAHLPTGETLSLYVAQQGGEAWNCMAECKANPMYEGSSPDARGVVMGPVSNGAYDGMLALGPSTASPPVTDPED
jgi:hypothetical protein